MSYMILGRAVKNEYLSLGTILGTAGIAYAATRGGGGGGAKKDQHAASTGGSLKDKIESVKAAVPFGAGSSEEEQFIKKFIEDEEKKSSH